MKPSNIPDQETRRKRILEDQKRFTSSMIYYNWLLQNLQLLNKIIFLTDMLVLCIRYGQQAWLIRQFRR